MNEFLNKAA